jgi:hypothetical protein
VECDEDLPEDSLHPSHDFVTRRVGRLVEVDDTGADVGLKITLKRGGTSRDRSEVTGANKHYIMTGLANVSRIALNFFFFSP